MKVTNTPGPWKVRKAWDDDGYEVYPTRDRKPEFGQWAEVACVSSCVSKGESAQKNAMLIAAAPDLLALLIRYRNETPLGHQPHMIAHEADAAIAKATGEKA